VLLVVGDTEHGKDTTVYVMSVGERAPPPIDTASVLSMLRVVGDVLLVSASRKQQASRGSPSAAPHLSLEQLSI
jgi:hypothetical protein